MLGDYLLLACLLVLSGFFSSSETAFFSLNRAALAELKKKGRLAALTVSLASDLHALLLVILFGNMIVNVSFFAISFALGARPGGPGPAVTGAVALLAIILLGEILPKLVAAKAPFFCARMLAIPLYLFSRLFRPIARVLERFPIAQPIPARDNHLSTEEMKTLIEMTEKAGHIDAAESDLFSEVVEFAEVIVKEAMVPRVDMVGFELPGSREAVLRMIKQTGSTKIAAWEKTQDNIRGYVDGKDLLLEPDQPLSELLRPVVIVPETKRVEDLLREFIHENTRFAVIVDEYGGTEGIVTLEHLLGEIVGEIEDEGQPTEAPAVVELEPGRYLLRGNLSLRDWAELFDIDVDAPQVGTLAGFVTKLLGHVPKPGDAVRCGDLLMTVKEVHGHRVTRILVEGSDLHKAGGLP